MARPIAAPAPLTRFGSLTFMHEAPTVGRYKKWLVRCDCGVECVKDAQAVRQGHAKSCGCLEHRRSHGQSGLAETPEYKAWENMKSRCLIRTPGWANYGGRGITICQRWLESFPAFSEDMGQRPGPGYSLDRIDNNGNYEPGNCRWATKQEQMRNMRRNRLVEWNGERRSMAEWAGRLGVHVNTLAARLARWPIEKAMVGKKQ